MSALSYGSYIEKLSSGYDLEEQIPMIIYHDISERLQTSTVTDN